MKITVLTITILMLVAGLAMVQMDANTENQIQVLRETEMLTTQGLGDCEIATFDTDAAGKCATKACFQIPLFNLAAELTAQDYSRCRVKSDAWDCIEGIQFKPDGTIETQICAEGPLYRDGICDPKNKIGKLTIIEELSAVSVPGCDNNNGGGGGSTSS